jgi:hypothetical protein
MNQKIELYNKLRVRATIYGTIELFIFGLYYTFIPNWTRYVGMSLFIFGIITMILYVIIPHKTLDKAVIDRVNAIFKGVRVK